jgi:hypothetical protein
MSSSPPNPTTSELCLPRQGHAILTYHYQGEMQRTEHETFEQGHTSSHDENTCRICQARRELEEPMRGVESFPAPRHSDFENDFAEAGLGQPSYDDNDEDFYETTCTGIRDIIFTGEVRDSSCIDPLISGSDHFAKTDTNHGMAWGSYTFLGRVRSWDGLIALVRIPVRVHSPGDLLLLEIDPNCILISVSRLDRTRGDEPDGSSEDTSTTAKCSLAAGVV